MDFIDRAHFANLQYSKERFPNVGFTDISSALYHDLVSIGQNDHHGDQSFFIPLQSPQLFVQIDEQNCS